MHVHHRFLDNRWGSQLAVGLMRLMGQENGVHTGKHMQRLTMAADIQQLQILLLVIGLIALPTPRQPVIDAFFAAD